MRCIHIRSVEKTCSLTVGEACALRVGCAKSAATVLGRIFGASGVAVGAGLTSVVTL